MKQTLMRIMARIEFRAGVLSGVLVALAAPPLPLGVLGYVALVPILVVMFSPQRIREEDPLSLRTLVLSFALTEHLLQLHWLMFLGDASPLEFKWAMPILLILLALFASIPEVFIFWLLDRLRFRRGAQAIWWMPGLWVLMEWLRAQGEMGFPWLGLGVTQLQIHPILQIAGVFGELGVSFFVLWVNVMVAVIWMSVRGEMPGFGRAMLSRWWAPATLLLFFSVATAYGVSTIRSLDAERETASHLTVGAVQANVDLRDKWDPAKRDSTFVPYTRGTIDCARNGADLVIWAETAIPFDLPSRRPYFDHVADLARTMDTFLYLGYVERRVDDEGRLDSSNSSLLMGKQGSVLGRYRKSHLLPLGERMPFQSILPILGRIDFGQAEWTPGEERTIFEVEGHRFAALICFESVFSRFGREGVRDGAGFLVNITNDGWFGNTVLPYQHGWMAAMRSAENRVPMVRVANNGVSFSVDSAGRVSNMTGLFERDRFVVQVTPRPQGSFYTRYGDGPILGIVTIGFVFLLLVGWQTERSRDT